MLKFVNAGIVFQEIPDEVTLSINISNCPCHCPGCHSRYLWEDIGQLLDEDALDRLVRKYADEITCVCFMGGDADPRWVEHLARYVKSRFREFKIGWYSGRLRLPKFIDKRCFDYIKLGPYLQHLGGLKESTTNQRLYKRTPDGSFVDITRRFWRDKNQG